MHALLILAAALLLGQQTNPKGHRPPSIRKASLVDLKKENLTKEIAGKETTVKTYLDSRTKKRFRTFEVQNNIFRYDLEVNEEGAKTSLLDNDGDGKFEVRLPFEKVDPKPPAWIVKVTRLPSKILNLSRLPVLRDARLLQKTAFQRGNEGPPLPVLILFFVEETKPPDKESQINPSVAMALAMERIAKKYKGKLYPLGYRMEPRPKREMSSAIRVVDETLGSKVKKVPAFAIFTVQKGVDRKTKREYLRLKFQQRVRETILMMEDIPDFEERVTDAIKAFLRKLE